MTVECVNTQCGQWGIPKSCEVPLRPGEHVLCGECGQPCEANQA